MIRMLRKLRQPAKAILEEGHVVMPVRGEDVRVTVRRSARATRYGLRIANATGEVILTVPRTGDYDQAIRFLESHEGWLAGRLSRRPGPVPFSHGQSIPFRGEQHTILATGKARGVVEVRQGEEGPELSVPGSAEHMPRRLKDWLKEQAREDLAECVADHAGKIDAKPGRITVRDTASRWGSCSSKGGLSFSWRLILAPPFVLDYVAAHEVAHLEHMNHSSRFWALTKRLFPETDRAEAWLKQHGRDLHRYGRDD
ncbi:M48 family metallopeptidase [Tepidamorphus sp. 3E244]|uniref:M48 family metallopeptidase n=1 Tax=Tepidamorphus sp. 3E244 TaxID=3385498 RepID=UPI0038FD0A57